MQNDDRPPWNTLVWLGVLCGFTLGCVVVLLFRRNDSAVAAPDRQLGDGHTTWNMFPGIKPMSSKTRKTVARSAFVGPGVPTEIVRATGEREWAVTVRTVGPPGSFGIFSTGNNPAESISVPAGSYQLMYLQNGESLYAQGDVPGVEVAVSGGEA